MKMKKVIIPFIIIILFLSTNTLGFGAEGLLDNNINAAVFQEIAKIEDKTIVIDKIIGDIHVKYWQHTINGFLVKNDSILLHLDPENDDILKYKKSWTNVEIDLLDFDEDLSERDNYVWKQRVVFPDEDDSGIFCNFYAPVDYPLSCWEVRYTDGTTLLYDSSGNEIGDIVPAPSQGCTLRGYGDTLWNSWRDSAKKWFDKWCGYVYNKERPTTNQISYYISRPQVEYFYVIAHSGHQSNRFSANDEDVYYYADQLHEDMLDRSPINLAVLCCCSAMEDTGPGTLSYEFRKGQMTNTVTIGYFNMGACGSWPWYSIPWQEFMFEKMDDSENYTMKEAFDLACAEYPCIEPYVRFVGDEDIKIQAAVDLVSQSEESTVEINTVETGCEYSIVSQSLLQSESTVNSYKMTDLINIITQSTNK